MIVLASLAVATIFLHASIQDFTSSTVVTTIATTTASLSEVYFPSVILCSINQIRKSLFTVSLHSRLELSGTSAFSFAEPGSEQNWGHSASPTDILLRPLGEPDRSGAESDHSVRFQVRWQSPDGSVCNLVIAGRKLSRNSCCTGTSSQTQTPQTGKLFLVSLQTGKPPRNAKRLCGFR